MCTAAITCYLQITLLRAAASHPTHMSSLSKRVDEYSYRSTSVSSSESDSSNAGTSRLVEACRQPGPGMGSPRLGNLSCTGGALESHFSKATFLMRLEKI